ncbi:hypothetical protein [Streptomyces sp. NPDC018045]|uniref:hypothetical protein n=1 Tax=Streptomyces sp. NPDC018045 TaxID=3365037 RepID=UPI0037B64078
MHGPVPAPPPHRSAPHRTAVLLRVAFVALAVLSLGFLAWVTVLRAALVQRRPLGWWLLGADLALVLTAIVIGGGHDENSWQSNVCVALILLQMVGAVVYFLIVDGRAQRVAPDWPAYGAGAGYGTPAVGAGYGTPAVGTGYGYPGPAAVAPAPHPYTGAPVPSPPPGRAPEPLPQDWPYARTHTQGAFPHRPPAQPAPQPHRSQHPAAHEPFPDHPYDQPQPPYPAQPQRIDRVRAELDELSDFLRKEEGR